MKNKVTKLAEDRKKTTVLFWEVQKYLVNTLQVFRFRQSLYFWVMLQQQQNNNW